MHLLIILLFSHILENILCYAQSIIQNMDPIRSKGTQKQIRKELTQTYPLYGKNRIHFNELQSEYPET